MYWFNRDLATQSITVWPTPENSTDDIVGYRMRRLQDVTGAAQTLDLPYHWFEAFAAGLAWRLAVKFTPGKVGVLKPLADEAFAEAKRSEREGGDTQMSIG